MFVAGRMSSGAPLQAAVGVTKDATGSFRAALIDASVVVVVEALVILYVRTRVMSERRERAAAVEQPLAVPL